MFHALLQWLEQQEMRPLFLLLSFLLFSFLFIFNKHRINNYNFPPSPWKLPLIGNLHQLGSFPHRSLRSLAQKHGPLMLLHVGRVPTLVVSSPSVALEILTNHDLVFSSRPVSNVSKRLTYNHKDIAYAPYGEYWRQVRKMCVVQLLSAKSVQSFRFVREEETTLMVENIKAQLGLVDLSKMLASLTNDIICRASLGKKYGGSRFRDMIAEAGVLMGEFDIGELIPWLAWVNKFNGFDARVEKNFKEFDTFIDGVVEEHMQRRQRASSEGKGKDEEEDFVDILLRVREDPSIGFPFTRDHIKGIISDLFVAGTETTFITLVWAMAELLRHPEVMKELQKEIREITKGKSKVTEDEIEKMYYLKAVIKETLRLHPSLPLSLPHESIENTKIQDYDILAKTTLIINVWAIGRDPKSWEDPEEFKPERFMTIVGNSIDFRGKHFQLIPFGGGRRGCPGAHFAISAVELALANLLNEFDWALPDGMNGNNLDMCEGVGLTAPKKSSLVLTAMPRAV